MSRKFLVPLLLPADPAAALEAATKQYVDGRVSATGDVMTGALLIHLTGAALRARQTNGTTEGLVMDTSTGLQLRNGLPLRTYADNAAAVPTFRIEGTTGDLYVAGSSPGVAVGANLGTGGTVAIGYGTDTYFQLQTTGGTGGAVGVLATITFASARPNAQYSVFFVGASANGASNPQVYATSKTGSGFGVSSRFAPASGTAYYYECFVIGMGA